jgi:hypothetical protein
MEDYIEIKKQDKVFSVVDWFYRFSRFLRPFSFVVTVLFAFAVYRFLPSHAWLYFLIGVDFLFVLLYASVTDYSFLEAIWPGLSILKVVDIVTVVSGVVNMALSTVFILAMLFILVRL